MESIIIMVEVVAAFMAVLLLLLPTRSIRERERERSCVYDEDAQMRRMRAMSITSQQW